MRSSAYEHQIPEQLFSTETEQAEGVSTAKALAIAIAMAQGQRIYTLTSANASQLLSVVSQIKLKQLSLGLSKGSFGYRKVTFLKRFDNLNEHWISAISNIAFVTCSKS